jgi:hypothetical protein
MVSKSMKNSKMLNRTNPSNEQEDYEMRIVNAEEDALA